MKMCSFAQNIRLLPLVAICLEKLTLLCEGLKAIHYEFTEILMKMSNFNWNIGLLPLIAIVPKN